MGGKARKNRCYAFLVDGEQGIVSTWAECEAITRGRPARFRGFSTEEEAQEWLEDGAPARERERSHAEARGELPEDAVYFDSGTGRGMGTEVRVTDREGTSLIHLVVPASRITKEGNMRLSGKTNNFGELAGLFLALKVARKMRLGRIFGDSKLVIDFWSKGHIRKKTAEDPALLDLVEKTHALRQEFESEGGTIDRISGSINPADLGFHRD